MNIKATLSPEDVARACADAMWKEDDASKGLGMELVEIKPGQAVMAMTVQPHMVNGQRICHGGYIFTLADSAFAFACNSRNDRAVAPAPFGPRRPKISPLLTVKETSSTATTVRAF